MGSAEAANFRRHEQWFLGRSPDEAEEDGNLIPCERDHTMRCDAYPKKENGRTG